MKRIVIIFTIVCVLLSFVGAAYPTEETIKPPKPGDFWNRLVNLDEMIGHKISDTMKGLYIKGVAQGILLTLGLIDLSEIDKEGIIIDYGYFILKHIKKLGVLWMIYIKILLMLIFKLVGCVELLPIN